jgi:flagellar motor switch protein FliM
VLDDVTNRSLLAGREVADAGTLRHAIGARVGDAPLEVAVRFGEITLTSREVVGLKPGDVVPLGHRTDRPLSVCVGGVDRFAALPGRRGNRLACVLIDPAAPNPGAR